MTDATMDASGTVSGTLYATTGSDWLGAPYDPSRFVPRAVRNAHAGAVGPDAGRMSYTGTVFPVPQSIYRFLF